MFMTTRTSCATRMLSAKLAATILLALVCLVPPTTAWAKDSLSVTVTAVEAGPDVKINGDAPGTIQLFYVVQARQFTLGPLASFDVNWETIASANANTRTDYGTGLPLTLNQAQRGGHVELGPSPEQALLTAAGQTGTSRVTVTIVAKDGKLPAAVDGTELVGNLRLDSAVGSPTNIQVHILLAHPAINTCLNVYTFVTDQDFDQGTLETAVIGLKKDGTVNNSQPGQFSDNVLIVSTCPNDESFDLRIGLDAAFSTNPHDNPGNAVYTYSAAGQVESSQFNVMRVNGTAQGQKLCLQNVTVKAGTSFLATVHSMVKKGLPKGSLPTATGFLFHATLYEDVNSVCTGAPEALAAPSPAVFALPFTIKQN